MTSKPSPSSPKGLAPLNDEELCLLGVTRLPDFIEFVRARAIDGHAMDAGLLVDMWREAAGVFAGLQISEAGAADKPEVRPLSGKLMKHVEKLAKLASFQSSFAAVPVSFGLVELDKLIVSQQHITRSSVDRMTETLQMPLSDTALADLCLPLESDISGFRVALQEDGRCIFTSDSHDARFLGAQLVKPSDIKGYKAGGHAQAVLALAVGYTTNVLNVVRFGQRMVLNNGYHRAMALRQLGVTHAPCLIQVCAHWEEVGMVGSQEIYHNAPVYFTASRPPLLRDFSNPQLTKSFAAARISKEIRLTYEVDSVKLGL